ncbi:DUF4091 domain-containing protein [Labilibacter sediminis]|nr:DUF4091 domain-containing protein [Labilibacter sediminis]
MIMKLVCILLTLHLFSNMINSQSLQGSFESKFKRYQKNESFVGEETQSWHTVVWKGERIYKQIVLWSSYDINNLSYDISALIKGNDQISSSNIKLSFGKYIKGDPEARSCSAYPTHEVAVEIIDALSNEPHTSITSQDPLKLWVIIDVPEATVAGVYTGNITVKGVDTPLIFNLELKVVDYTLPDVSNWSFHLDLWQFPVNNLDRYNDANWSNKITTWSDEHFDLIEPAYRLLANVGQKVITTYIKDGALGAESMVKWIKKTDGTWEYDFTVFDKYVTKLMSWGITEQISCFSPVGWNESQIPYWNESTNQKATLNAPLNTSTYSTRWNHFLTAFKIHLDEKGWFDKTVLYLDEVSEAKLNNVISVVHGNDPDWKLGIAYSHGLSNESKSHFYDISGILEDASNQGITEGKVSTFYTSCTQKNPNNYITPENNSAEMTWMCWHALSQGYDGYLRWAYDYWRLSDPFDARDGAHTAGDFSMIYRSSNTDPVNFLSSLRLEMLREGIEDFEKIKILKDALLTSTNPADHVKLELLNSVVLKFNKTSGVNAEEFVREGQNVINDIVDVTSSYIIPDNSYVTGKIRAYPNPLDGNTVTIELPDVYNKKVHVAFLSSNGCVIQEDEIDSFSNTGKVYLSKYIPKGVYFLKVSYENRSYTIKLLAL